MSFDFILTPDISLYRSAKRKDKLIGEWYCFNPEDTFGYGSITGEFRPVKSLKLLDITKNSFYSDFRDKIIDYSKTNILIKDSMNTLLFPLGFSDTTIYTKFANKVGIPIVSTVDLNLELDTQYYGNRSRCSILQLDIQLIRVLKMVYSDYDGIVSPINLPNILANGYQHSEMCIFDKTNITLIKEIPRNHIGGTMDLLDRFRNPQKPIPIVGAISLDNEFTREYTNYMKDFVKTFKPLPNNSVIEKDSAPHVLIQPINEPPNYNTNDSNKKNRKTRKRKNV